jgi:hypothetical protein
MSSISVDQAIVWAHSDTAAFNYEFCDWFRSDSIAQLHTAATTLINDQLHELYAQFSEELNLAEFPDVEEQLSPSEAAVFRKAAGAHLDTDSQRLEHSDCFTGLCTVIRQRLEQPSLAQIKGAAELFNWTMDSGLACCDGNPNAIVRVGNVKEVAPFLFERILYCVHHEAAFRASTHQDQMSGVEQRFGSMVPLLTMLRGCFESGDSVGNELAIKLFFWIAEKYQAEVTEENH